MSTIFLNENRVEEEIEILKGLIQTPEIEKKIKRLEYGLLGENQVRFELANSGIHCYVIQDLFIECEDLTAQIDFLVICPKCNYVIECKNLYGNVDISSEGEFTRTTDRGKEAFYSPIVQNERHIRLIKKIIRQTPLKKLLISEGADDVWKNVVVLTNPKSVIHNQYGGNVMRADQLVDFIKRTEKESRNLKCSDKDMRKSAERWLDRAVEPNYAEKYIPTCPRCNSLMVKRIARKGEHAGEEFYGCPNYPKCNYTIYQSEVKNGGL